MRRFDLHDATCRVTVGGLGFAGLTSRAYPTDDALTPNRTTTERATPVFDG